MAKKVFRVKGMHCPNCAMRIEGIEDSLPGIQRINVNYVREMMVVEYDENLVKEDEILTKVVNLGYGIEIE